MYSRRARKEELGLKIKYPPEPKLITKVIESQRPRRGGIPRPTKGLLRQ